MSWDVRPVSFSLIFPRRSPVGFCSSECEQATWTMDWHSGQAESPGEMVNRPELDQFHRFECGQRKRIMLTDVGGLQWLKSIDSAATASATLQRYRKWLRKVDPIQSDALNIRDVLLAFACVARTHWRTIWRLVKDLPNEEIHNPTQSGCRAKRSSSLFAFSGQETMSAAGIQMGTYESVSWRRAGYQTRSAEDLWQRTVAAVFLAHCLSAGGYPLDWQDDPMLNPAMAHTDANRSTLPASWAAACLLYHLQSVPCSAHGRTNIWYEEQYSEASSPGTDWDRIEIGSVAGGIYSMLTLVSNSCHQNSVIITMDGIGEGLFARRTIKAGTEITLSLGNRYDSTPKQERRNKLRKRYGIDCQCIACRHNWPLENPMIFTLRCQCCGRQIAMYGFKPAAHEGPSGCRCPMRIKHAQVLASALLHDQLIAKRFSVIRTFERIPFHQISASTLDKCIAEVVQEIKKVEEQDFFQEPCDTLGVLEDLLRQLLNARHGQCYTLSVELSKTPPNNRCSLL
ncbi:unnamed protein product [Dicrocoelium dendriticum]|nr:unnamed protein product [Dicrocoelium dendriticum]